MRTALFIAVALMVATLAHAEDKKYTLADLKALVAEKHYLEALQHLSDIAPAERKAEWNDVLGQAGLGFAQSGKDAIEKLRNMLAVEEQYPSVVKNAKYAALRTEVGPKGFEVCFSRSYDVSDCKTYAIKFIDDDPSNGKLALAMAKVARKGMNAYGAAPLFKRAVASTKKGACKDGDLSHATIAALGLPSDYDDFTDGKSVAESCFTELRPAILKALETSGSGYYKDNTCALLVARKDKAGVGKLCWKDDDD
jgi:hypothetical protein